MLVFKDEEVHWDDLFLLRAWSLISWSKGSLWYLDTESLLVNSWTQEAEQLYVFLFKEHLQVYYDQETSQAEDWSEVQDDDLVTWLDWIPMKQSTWTDSSKCKGLKEVHWHTVQWEDLFMSSPLNSTRVVNWILTHRQASKINETSRKYSSNNSLFMFLLIPYQWLTPFK